MLCCCWCCFAFQVLELLAKKECVTPKEEVEHFSSMRCNAFLSENTVKTDNDDVPSLIFFFLFHSPVLPKNALLLSFLSSPGIVRPKRSCDTEGELETLSRWISTMSFFDICFSLAPQSGFTEECFVVVGVLFCLSSPGIASQERVCDTEGEV